MQYLNLELANKRVYGLLANNTLEQGLQIKELLLDSLFVGHKKFSILDGGFHDN